MHQVCEKFNRNITKYGLGFYPKIYELSYNLNYLFFRNDIVYSEDLRKENVKYIKIKKLGNICIDLLWNSHYFFNLGHELFNCAFDTEFYSLLGVHLINSSEIELFTTCTMAHQTHFYSSIIFD